MFFDDDDYVDEVDNDDDDGYIIRITILALIVPWLRGHEVYEAKCSTVRSQCEAVVQILRFR